MQRVRAAYRAKGAAMENLVRQKSAPPESEARTRGKRLEPPPTKRLPHASSPYFIPRMICGYRKRMGEKPIERAVP